MVSISLARVHVLQAPPQRTIPWVRPMLSIITACMTEVLTLFL
jgi:hypothetical protein